MKPRSKFETQVLFAFGMAILVAAGLSGIIWNLAGAAAEAAQQVSRVQQILHALAQAKVSTLQIELSTQSFRISGDTARLTERDAAVDKRERLLKQIEQLAMDDAALQQHWRQLREVIAQRLAISREIERLRKTQGQVAADAYVSQAPLQETRTRVHHLLDEMEQQERHRLEVRSAEQQRTGRRLRAVGGIAAALLLALLAATFVVIRRQLREAEASRRLLEDSEERLSITLRSIADAVMATDMDGHITRMNPVAERLTGWSFVEAQGLPVDEVFSIVDEGSGQQLTGPVAAVLSSGQAQSRERGVALQERGGHTCPIAMSVSPKRDLGGRIRGTVLAFRDVSLERQAQRSIETQNELLAERVQERTAQLRQSEAHLLSVTRNVPALIAYVDAGRRYVYANQQYQQCFAPERESIVGCTVRDILGETRYALADPMITKVLSGEAQTYDWQPFAGIWQVINYVPQHDASGQVVGYYVLGSDITERKHAEDRINTLNAELESRVQELERVSRALRTLSAGNRTMLRASDEAELLKSMCQAIVTVGGYGMAIVWYRADDEFKSLRPMAECGYPSGLEVLRRLKVSWADGEFSGGAAAASMRSGQTCVVTDMYEAASYKPWQASLAGFRSVLACPLRIDEVTFGVLAIYDTEPDTFDADEVTLLTESADDLAFGIATLRARAEQERVRAAMYRLTHHDALTGLPNEAQFAEALGQAIERSLPEERPFAILQTNIDRLREVNDALGFDHGDQMLREFGARLSEAAPSSALVARLRGDEFATLLFNGDRSAATALLQRMEELLAAPFAVADIPLDVSSKTGIALFPEHGTTPHDLFRHMDIAVHQARKRGVRHAFFDPAQDTHDHPARLTMASELRRAIEGEQLRLYLQPKVEMASGRVCGAEALVRWMHPARGLVPPGDFIELAEHTGLIRPLTDWMLAAVLRQSRLWVDDGYALPIAVNISARNLRDEGLPERIWQLQSELALEPGLLELEITESTLMDDAEFSLGMLMALREQGIPLCIDDFGTGYSSLSYLQRLPVSYIKIDQSFIRDMSSSKDSAVIVRSTIDLVHDLDRRIVAEGIETQEHWDQLLRMGCDIGQGYFIARPMPTEEFQAWWRRFESTATTN